MSSVVKRLAFTMVATFLTCGLIMPVVSLVPAVADDPVVVYFRVEGPADKDTFAETGEYQVIFAGFVNVPTDVNITTVTSNTWHLYVKASDSHYWADCTAGSRAGETHDRGAATQSIGATSVLAALEQASQQGGFTYEVSDNWFPGMGMFVGAIGGHSASGAVGWSYRVWNPTDAYMPNFACDMFLLGYGSMPLALPHEQVLWYWGASSSFYPLKVTSDKATVGVGEEFTATVEYYRDLGWSGTGSWERLAGATVEVAGETFATDDNGEAGIHLESEGTCHLTARKGCDGGMYYVPSDSRTELTVFGGDTSSWWIQTTQGDFAAGTPNQVDTSASPGDVELERGGTVTEDFILNGGTAELGGEYFYDQFKIINGGTLNVPQGEILRVHANYIEVDATSTMNADGRGYSGGDGKAENGDDGFGMGGGSGGIHSGSHGGGGGGAGHNKDGGAGSYGTVEEAAGGGGGYKYGKNCRGGDDTFYLGSGGGGGAGNGVAAGGVGGDGGGTVVLEGMSLQSSTTVVVSGTITADGEDGSNGADNGCGGGGGGSGGTILIKGKNMSIANGALSVEAGDGGDMGGTGGGGGGGGTGGHIKVFFESCNDSSGHHTTRGYGGDGDPYDGSQGWNGSGSRRSYWYDYLAHGETYSSVLPYHDSGTLISTAYDIGYEADFGKLRWCAATPSDTGVKFQIATNNDNATWDFKGPDGTANTYYETSGTDIWSGHDGDRHIKYKAFLSTTEPGETPTLSKVGITYTEAGGEIVSFTVTDYGNDGIIFGTLDPGQETHPADWGDSQGAVTLTVGTETNVDVDVQLKGADFAGPGAISIGNVKYNDCDNPGGADTLTTTYVTWYIVTVPLSVDDVTQVYYWISVPGGQEAGDYSSTFYYRAVKSE